MQPIYSSPAIDIWAVGVLACELLLGQVPAELARASLGPAPAPAAELELPQELSAEACAFIRAALCRDPRQRPSARKLLKHAWLQAFASVRTRSHLLALCLCIKTRTPATPATP